MWVARYPKQPPDIRTDTYEKGLYQCFDVNKWARETRELTLHYAHLAQKLPGEGGGAANQAAASKASQQLYEAMQAAKRRREQQQLHMHMIGEEC